MIRSNYLIDFSNIQFLIINLDLKDTYKTIVDLVFP